MFFSSFFFFVRLLLLFFLFVFFFLLDVFTVSKWPRAEINGEGRGGKGRDLSLMWKWVRGCL